MDFFLLLVGSLTLRTQAVELQVISGDRVARTGGKLLDKLCGQAAVDIPGGPARRADQVVVTRGVAVVSGGAPVAERQFERKPVGDEQGQRAIDGGRADPRRG